MPFETDCHSSNGALFQLENMIERGSEVPQPAAIIVETVQAEGGINVASVDWIRRLSELAARNKVVLIVDDIQVGCGRTGTFFSFERAGIKPDIVCLSKAIGGMGMPMAITLIKPELDVWSPGEHLGTFRGNNLAFVAGAAALDFWRSPLFTQQLEARSQAIRNCLVQILGKYPEHVKEIRGIGMIQGLVGFDPKFIQSVLRAAFDCGLIVETAGRANEVLKLLPPLTISDSELEEGLSILASAVAQAVRNARAASH
jgi:diaminobutyrate-2-oxoglutarate transaminase